MLYLRILGVGILQQDPQMPGIPGPYFPGERFRQDAEILGIQKSLERQRK
jgi:hypothetical protein